MVRAHSPLLRSNFRICAYLGDIDVLKFTPVFSPFRAFDKLTHGSSL